MRRTMGCLLCVLSALALVGPASAQAFYQGKTITIISGASGGYEAYSRLIARFLPKYIPGEPTVIVKPMSGAASMTAANFLYFSAAPDGLTIGSFVRSIPFAPLLGDKAARYDSSKFVWIGSASSYREDAYLLMVRKELGVHRAEQLKTLTTPLRLGSTGPSSEADVGTRVIQRLLGYKLTQVRGYAGTPNIALAVEQGEMDGMMIGISSLGAARPAWLQPNPSVQFLIQFGFGGEGRHPQFPDVPRVDELASNSDKAIFELMQMPFKAARPFAGPPNIPSDRRAILERGFWDAQHDPQYLAEAKKQGLDVSPVRGAQVEQIIRQASSLPKELIDRYRAILQGN